MPTLHANLVEVLLWGTLGFVLSVIYCSYFEWALHRYVMHRRVRIFPLPFNLHAVQHHGIFGGDETYHARSVFDTEHVTFVARDYILLTLVNIPVFLAAEWASGKPVALGCTAAVLTYLQVFNSLHLRWHCPKDSWLERTSWFSWMKERHRVHHGNPTRNLNLIVPLGDLTFGTYGPKRAA